MLGIQRLLGFDDEYHILWVQLLYPQKSAHTANAGRVDNPVADTNRIRVWVQSTCTCVYAVHRNNAKWNCNGSIRPRSWQLASLLLFPFLTLFMSISVQGWAYKGGKGCLY